MSINELTEKIYSLSTNYNEYAELNENINNVNNFEKLKLTRERYIRYINGINIWYIDELNIDAGYIKDLIVLFLKETEKLNKFEKKYIEMMEKIDFELKKLIDIL